ACVYRNVKPLVWIERKAIRALQTGKQIFLSLVQNTRRAVSAIYVKPKIEFTSDICDLSEWINRAGVDRACAAGDAKGPQSFTKICVDPLPQQVNAHPLSLVAADDAHLLAPVADNVSRLCD